MFRWDGSDITNIISGCDIYTGNFNKLKYWIIHFNEHDNDHDNDKIGDNDHDKEICIVRTSKNTLSCLVDEIKSVFNLEKIGTHWCKINGKIYILFKCVYDKNGYIKEETTLSNFDNILLLNKDKIQEVFVFRELLGVTCSYESSIIVRENKIPISFYEPNMTTEDVKVIPGTVLDKWFEDTSIDQVVKRLCKINNIDELPMVLYELRNKLEKIIERVDKRAITYKDCIMNRITQRLQTSLN